MVNRQGLGRERTQISSSIFLKTAQNTSTNELVTEQERNF